MVHKMRPAVFLRKYGRILLGGSVLALIILTTLAAPLITPYDPASVSPAEGLQFPNPVHLMGTDRFGRDVFAWAAERSALPLCYNGDLVSAAG